MTALNRDVREVIREEPVMRPGSSRPSPTARSPSPQIAEAIGAPTHEVVFWVMGMRRYGWLAEIKGSDADGYFQLRSHADGCPDDRDHRPPTPAPRRRRPRALPGAPAVRRDRHQRLLLLRHLHRDLPAVADRRHVPAPDHPLRPAGHEGRAPLSKELWTCYQCGECAETLPHAGRPVRVHGGDPALRDRQLRQDPARPDDVHAAGPGDGLRRRSWRCSSPRSCTPPAARWTARPWRSSSSSRPSSSTTWASS